MNQIVNRPLVVATIVALSLAVAGSAFAGEKQAAKQANSKPMELSGEVTAIDVAGSTVTVVHKDRTMKFKCDAHTKVYVKRVKEAVKFDALRQGDKVTVLYHGDSGVLLAERIGEQGANANDKSKQDAKQAQPK